MCVLYSEGAVGVVNKGALTLDDAELKKTMRKPVKELPFDTKRLLVKGLSDKTTRDGLQSYMEVVSGVEVLSIEFGQQGSAAVTFDETHGKFDEIYLKFFVLSSFVCNQLGMGSFVCNLGMGLC